MSIFKSPLFMMAQLPFNSDETVALNTPMIQVMDDSGNAKVAIQNLRELGVLDHVLEKGTSFIEVGCGSGYLLEELTKRGKGNYMGFEPIHSEYQKALGRLSPYFEGEKKIPVQNSLLEESGYPENSLDYIYSYHVFEHLENPLVMIESALRWLKPGGKMIITCPNVEGYMPRKNLKAWRCSLPSHRWLPGVSTITRAISENGMDVKKVFSYGGLAAPRNIFKSIFNKYLKITNQGDVLTVMAEKPRK